MAKSKAMVISAPMDAKHVGGVNVMAGGQQSGIDVYFKSVAIAPDELPSHTFVATGKTETPRRSDTIATTIRRPSLSIKRSFSKLRRTSISHPFEPQLRHETEHQSGIAITRKGSTSSQKPLRMQSSMSHLRQRVGLDKDLRSDAPGYDGPSQRPATATAVRRSDSRFTLRSLSTSPEPKSSTVTCALHRKPSFGLQQVAVVTRKPSPSDWEPSIEERQSHVTRMPSSSSYIPAKSNSQPPNRPKRADSGTAIDLKSLPVDERPMGFKEILAVQSFEDRMRQYAKARLYWAHAEHGLMEWTQAAVKPRPVAVHS